MTVPRYDVLAIGRSSIDLYAHQIGVPMTEVTSFDAYVGGCPTNISVGTRRLGLRSALLTAVGDDQVGDFVLAFLEREGIETRFIPRKPKHRTSAVILTIQPPDRFPLTFYREGCADRELTCDDVRAAPVADSAIVFVTGTGLTHEPSSAATVFAADAARAAGREVFLDIDYRPDQWGSRADFAQTVQRLSARSSIVVGTEEEVAAAADDDDLARAIDLLLRTGPETLIVKRGAAGATIFTRGSRAACDSVVPDRGAERARRRRRVRERLALGIAARACRSTARLGWATRSARSWSRATAAPTSCRRNEVEAFVAAKGGW